MPESEKPEEQKREPLEPLEAYYTHYKCDCGWTQAWGPHAVNACAKCGGKLKLVSVPKV